MNSIETDFVEFVAQKNEEPVEVVQKRYEASKAYLNYGTKEYSHHEEITYQTLQVFFTDTNEKSLFESYRFYAYSDMLRMLSYSFPKSAPVRGYITTLIKAVREGDWRKIFSYISRRTTAQSVQVKKTKAEWLLQDYSNPVILDYGCGIAQLSFEMAQLSPGSEIILVDLDTLKLDFVEFRFKKHGIKHRIMRIQADDQYPLLPEHTICIATDVLEHLHEPLRAYAHIRDSMEKGGTLYGNFEDHDHGMYHVHPDLADLREAIAKDYIEVEAGLYKKNC